MKLCDYPQKFDRILWYSPEGQWFIKFKKWPNKYIKYRNRQKNNSLLFEQKRTGTLQKCCTSCPDSRCHQFTGPPSVPSFFWSRWVWSHYPTYAPWDGNIYLSPFPLVPSCSLVHVAIFSPFLVNKTIRSEHLGFGFTLTQLSETTTFKFQGSRPFEEMATNFSSFYTGEIRTWRQKFPPGNFLLEFGQPFDGGKLQANCKSDLKTSMWQMWLRCVETFLRKGHPIESGTFTRIMSAILILNTYVSIYFYIYITLHYNIIYIIFKTISYKNNHPENNLYVFHFFWFQHQLLAMCCFDPSTISTFSTKGQIRSLDFRWVVVGREWGVMPSMCKFQMIPMKKTVVVKGM